MGGSTAPYPIIQLTVVALEIPAGIEPYSAGTHILALF
jgi:hypothetical protein